jgi:hypothetical protein
LLIRPGAARSEKDIARWHESPTRNQKNGKDMSVKWVLWSSILVTKIPERHLIVFKDVIKIGVSLSCWEAASLVVGISPFAGTLREASPQTQNI